MPSHLLDTSQPFDLIINTYSLQEMDLDVTKAYMKYIWKNLSKDGKFFSINSPKKWEINHYSDYDFENFENLYSSMHRQVPPSGIAGTVPIVNLFKKRNQKSQGINVDIMNVIGELQTLGFSDFLAKKFSNGNLSITHPSEKLKNFVNTVIEVRDGVRVFDEGISEAYVLGLLLGSKKIPAHLVDRLLSSLGNNIELSEITILLLSKHTSHKLIRKKSSAICQHYNFKDLNGWSSLAMSFIRRFVVNLRKIWT